MRMLTSLLTKSNLIAVCRSLNFYAVAVNEL